MNEQEQRRFNQFSDLSTRLNRDSGDAWQVHEQALAMKQSEENVVLFSIGDPDFRTPEPIVDNAVSHMRVGRTHYSPALGELNLQRAVADYESRISPLSCCENEVSIYPGVTPASCKMCDLMFFNSLIFLQLKSKKPIHFLDIYC